MFQPQSDIPQDLSLKCTKVIIDTMKKQSTFQTLNQIEDLIQQYPKVAELYFFCAEINLALLKYENARSILQDGLKVRAEPQELLRDGLTMFQSIDKVLYPQTKIKPIILRKPPHDYYKLNYKINNKLMEELLSLAQFKLGGELIFEKNQQKQTQKDECTEKINQTKNNNEQVKDQIVNNIQNSQQDNKESIIQAVKNTNTQQEKDDTKELAQAYQNIVEEDSGCNYL